MAVKATITNTGTPVGKVRHILDLVRGMNVEQALEMLRFMPSPAATHVAKAVKSATANAENELLARTAGLSIVEAYANQAPRLKRFRPRARGRVASIFRNSSHITVAVDEEASEIGE